MAKAEITAGICGFSTTVVARMEGSRCVLAIESDCDAIRRLAEELTEVEPFQEISSRADRDHQGGRGRGQTGPPGRCDYQVIEVSVYAIRNILGAKCSLKT